MGLRGKPRAEHHPLGSGTGKLCRGCGKPRPLCAFSVKRTAWDGLNPRCKECVAAGERRSRAEVVKMRSRRRERESLVARAHRIAGEIDQIFLDAAAWNARHPDEPIDPDPDGQLARVRSAMAKVR